jgi:tetratricopeptide (TPR) repeat protein
MPRSGLGKCYLYQEKSAESYRAEQASWREAINREPKNPDAYIQLADSIIAEAAEGYWCTTRTIAVYRQAIAAVAPNAEIHARLGGELVGEPNVNCDLTENQAQKRARQKAGLVHIRKAIAIDPTKDDYYITLGNVLNEQGRSAAAIAAYKQAIALPVKPRQGYTPHYIISGESMPYRIIGDYLRSKADFQAAAAAYRKALAIQPDYPTVRDSLNQVELLLKLKRRS